MFIYKTFINFILTLLPFLSLFSKSLRDFLKYRNTAKANYLYPENDKKNIWFHSSSYGEFEGIATIDRYFKDQGQYNVVNSYFSPSGYENLRESNIYSYYLPFDKTSDINSFIRQISPILLVVSQNDYWPTLVSLCHKHGIKVIFVSSYIKSTHWWLKPLAKPIIRPLRQIEKIFMQDRASVRHAENHGFENVVYNGNTRIDRVIENQKRGTVYPILETFASFGPLLVAGSVIHSDIEILKAFADSNMSHRMLIVPHDIDDAHIELLEDAFHHASRYTQIKQGLSTQDKIIILDTIGDLKFVYQYASYAYIGGGFDKGPHSYLEPLSWNVPVISGPNIHKFPDAIELSKLGLLRLVEYRADMLSLCRELENGFNADQLRTLEAYFSDHKGASQRVIDYIELKLIDYNTS